MVIIIRKRFIWILLGVLILIGYMGVTTKEKVQLAMTMPIEQLSIVIDAGHGGRDPGKVGIDGQLEKDINLSIAKKLQSYLELSGAKVIMIRVDDNGLYTESDSNKKRADLKNRIEIVNQADAQIFVSIHQNSFSESKSDGAQVFYYKDSDIGKKLALCIEEEIRGNLDGNNTRKSKPNESYYLLKQSDIPAVIVECGFLSNYEEAKNLELDIYQQKVAWGIYMGIIKHFDNIR